MMKSLSNAISAPSAVSKGDVDVDARSQTSVSTGFDAEASPSREGSNSASPGSRRGEEETATKKKESEKALLANEADLEAGVEVENEVDSEEEDTDDEEEEGSCRNPTVRYGLPLLGLALVILLSMFVIHYQHKLSVKNNAPVSTCVKALEDKVPNAKVNCEAAFKSIGSQIADRMALQKVVEMYEEHKQLKESQLPENGGESDTDEHAVPFDIVAAFKNAFALKIQKAQRLKFMEKWSAIQAEFMSKCVNEHVVNIKLGNEECEKLYKEKIAVLSLSEANTENIVKILNEYKNVGAAVKRKWSALLTTVRRNLDGASPTATGSSAHAIQSITENPGPQEEEAVAAPEI